MSRASSLPETTCTSSPAVSRMRWTKSGALRASRVAAVATVTKRVAPCARARSANRAHTVGRPLHRRRLQQPHLAELALAQPDGLLLHAEHRPGVVGREAHDHEARRVGADVDVGDRLGGDGRARRRRAPRRRLRGHVRPWPSSWPCPSWSPSLAALLARLLDGVAVGVQLLQALLAVAVLGDVGLGDLALLAALAAAVLPLLAAELVLELGHWSLPSRWRGGAEIPRGRGAKTRAAGEPACGARRPPGRCVCGRAPVSRRRRRA